MDKDISKRIPNLHKRLVTMSGGGGGGTIQERALFFHRLSETGTLFKIRHFSTEGSNRASAVLPHYNYYYLLADYYFVHCIFFHTGIRIFPRDASARNDNSQQQRVALGKAQLSFHWRRMNRG